MAQIRAVFVFCSSCKILYFASSVHPKNAAELKEAANPFALFADSWSNF